MSRGDASESEDGQENASGTSPRRKHGKLSVDGSGSDGSCSCSPFSSPRELSLCKAFDCIRARSSSASPTEALFQSAQTGGTYRVLEEPRRPLLQLGNQFAGPGLRRTERSGRLTEYFGVDQRRPGPKPIECARSIYGCLGQSWLLRGSVFYRDNADRQRILDKFVGTVPGRERGLRIAADHEPSEEKSLCRHLHLYHTCTFHHGQCRCSFLSGIDIVHHPKYRLRVHQLGIDDIKRILVYYCKEGRSLRFIILGNTSTRIPDPATVLQDFGSEGPEAPGQVQEGLHEFDLPLQPVQLNTPSTSGHCGSGKRRNEKSGSTPAQLRSVLDQIEYFMRNYTVVPLESIVKSRIWLNSSLKWIDCGDSNFIKVKNLIQTEVCKMSLAQLEQFWLLKPYHFWDSKDYRENVKCHMQLDESVRFCNSFLKFQFDHDECLVKSFLLNLKCILNKETKKMNSLEVVSEPSAGKNYFFDSIAIFCVCHGQIQNHNKFSRFALENAIDKRLLIYNEPNFDKAFTETLLMVLAGDPVTAEAKYKPYTSLLRTPVIIMCNASPFSQGDRRWRERIYRVRWKRAEMLKGRDYPHPLTFINLLKLYNIKYN